MKPADKKSTVSLFENHEPKCDVVLINMPFTNLTAPSLALGLLRASLTRLGVSAKSLYFHLRFAEIIGRDLYVTIETETYPEQLVGEWVFAESLFQHPKSRDLESYVKNILEIKTIDMPDEPVYSKDLLDRLIPAIKKAKTAVAAFLDECVETVLSYEPRIVGFTSLFQQHVASLSLAARIKSLSPDTLIIFGGANCEGVMGAENFRQFDFIDVLVSGEGDLVFPQIVGAALQSKPIPQMPGVFDRRRRVLPLVNQPVQNTAVVENLDELPIPDYDDFFAQLSASSLKQSKETTLLFETSRGCWWGEKMHCTFCGLNGSTMAFRSKSARRAFDELLHLTGRHPGCSVNAVDNILDMKYFKTFLKFLAQDKREFGLFYEVKSNLRKDQLKSLSAAGVKTIQPGIESLSDNVLKIMKKGVSALQNLQLLKWCAELDLKVVYNIIWGFPGESDEDFRKMIDLIPLITHLRPPIGAGTIRIDRFSPNYNEHRQFGFGEVSPFPAYQYVYPFGREVIDNLAYYFMPEHSNMQIDRDNTRQLSLEIKSWIAKHQKSELFYLDKENSLLIWDWRPVAKKPVIVLDDYSRAAYLACDESRTFPQVCDFWRKSVSAALDEVRLKETLDSFVEQSLMIKDSGRYLALAYQKSMLN
jgi:ribosomal peptide maturation radical SAM protein 1